MNEELKQKWVDALRSGKYEQGRQFLKAADRYCCLGVLCDISGISLDKRNEELKSVFNLNQVLSYEEAETFFGKGSDHGGPQVEMINSDGDKWYPTLAELNDGGFTFQEIANVIEEQL